MIRRTKTDLFKVNGNPMFAPDADMDFSFEDIDSDHTIMASFGKE